MLKTIGIIGGMGPAATVDLMGKIVSMTDAQDDQHHIPICVDCNTRIPDRTQAILEHAQSPVPEMVRSAVRLEKMGADFLIMPCNTAHYFLEDIAGHVDIPIINMLEETAGVLKKEGVTRAAVLATDGTRQSGLYEKALAKERIRAIYPNEEQQKLLMHLIYDLVKRGERREAQYPSLEIRKMMREMRQKGAQRFILACTELPIAFELMGIDQDCVDPTSVLARAAVIRAGASVKASHQDIQEIKMTA